MIMNYVNLEPTDEPNGSECTKPSEVTESTEPNLSSSNSDQELFESARNSGEINF